MLLMLMLMLCVVLSISISEFPLLWRVPETRFLCIGANVAAYGLLYSILDTRYTWLLLIFTSPAILAIPGYVRLVPGKLQDHSDPADPKHLRLKVETAVLVVVMSLS